MAEITINLRELASRLADTHNKISRKIIQLSDLSSIKVDLCFADDQIRLLSGVREAALRSEAGTADQIVPMALLMSSVVLYVRATKSKSDHRLTFDIRTKFSDEEKARHIAICALRDDALAHFGPGAGEGSDALQQDGIFAIFDQEHGALQIATMSRRKVIDLSLVDLIILQIQRAILIVEQQIQKRREELDKELMTLLVSGEISMELWRSCEFDLMELFGDEEAKRHALDGPRTGHQKGMAQRIAQASAPLTRRPLDHT